MNEQSPLFIDSGPEIKKIKTRKLLLIAEVVVLSIIIMLISFPTFGAQFMVNVSNIDIEYLKITRPRENHFYIELSTTIKIPIYAPSVISMSKVDVYFKDAKLGSVNMPKTIVNGKVTKIMFNDKFIISDKNTMRLFSKELVLGREVRWQLRGSIDVNIFGFIHVSQLGLKKEMTIIGIHNVSVNLILI